jgi:hypothetical protein
MKKQSQSTTKAHTERVDLARIRAVLSNMEGTCAYLSGQLETASGMLDAFEIESLPDVAYLWPALLEHRKTLGMALSITLKDCECLSGAAGVMTLGVPKKSLSLGVLQAQEHQERVKALLTRLAGWPVGLDIVEVQV